MALRVLVLVPTVHIGFRNIMLRLALLTTCILVHTVGCTDDASLSASTGELQVNKRITDFAEANTTREYPLALELDPGSQEPLTFDVVATAQLEGSVRVQVYGPEHGGDRLLLVDGGIAQPRVNVELTATTKESGEHLIVVGSFQLETDTTFDLAAYCVGC